MIEELKEIREVLRHAVIGATSEYAIQMYVEAIIKLDAVISRLHSGEVSIPGS